MCSADGKISDRAILQDAKDKKRFWEVGGRTYYEKKSKTTDADKWIFNFTLDIVYRIAAEADTGIGGDLCRVKLTDNSEQ